MFVHASMGSKHFYIFKTPFSKKWLFDKWTYEFS
jgi:hypothetical protein